MSKQKLLVWDPAQKRWVPQRRTSGGGGGGGGGYSEVIVGGTSLTSDAGDPLTIASTPPIQVTGDADTDTVTIGIRMGPGSNLDADTVDGKHAADFALASHSHPNATTTSAGFMSAADKVKLDSIESGAQANQLAYSVVKVGSTSVAAQSTTDTLELEAGSNIALTPDAAARKVAVAVSPQGHTSGLDADLLDGQHASAFAPATHTHAPAQISPQGHSSGLDADTVDGKHASQFALSSHQHLPADIDPQGHTSGLDADLLDGQHASAFAPASHTHPDATPTTSGFMSAADKSKLDGIQPGAEVNQNAFSRVLVGATAVEADAKTDTLELAAGSNISLTADASNDKVTIAVSPQGAGSGLDADLLDGQHASAFALASHSHPNATPSSDGFMSAADKTKLDGIEAGAQVNQNAFSRVIVGSTNIDAGSATDALRLIAGANITLTPDAGNKSITIAASGGGGGGGGSGYGTVAAGSATLTADPGDTLTIQGQSPITVSGDAATDTVTIGIETGSGSGLDADTVDGMHAADFALSTHTHPDATTTASGFMSAADKSKLDGVQAGAEVNQLAYSHISVGSTTVSASSKTDTLSLVAGSNIGIAANAAARQLTFSVSPQGAGSGLDADLLDGLHAAAFALASHEHSLSVRLGENSSTITVNSTSPREITYVTLTAGRWIVIGVLQATASSTTSATFTGYLRSGTYTYKSLAVSANSTHGLVTLVLVMLHTVTSGDTINLAASTPSSSYPFSVPTYGGYLLAIRYAP
jgi:hypothetical protein